MRSRVPPHCTAQLIRGKIRARWCRKREESGKSSSKRCNDKLEQLTQSQRERISLLSACLCVCIYVFVWIFLQYIYSCFVNVSNFAVPLEFFECLIGTVIARWRSSCKPQSSGGTPYAVSTNILRVFFYISRFNMHACIQYSLQWTELLYVEMHACPPESTGPLLQLQQSCITEFCLSLFCFAPRLMKSPVDTQLDNQLWYVIKLIKVICMVYFRYYLISVLKSVGSHWTKANPHDSLIVKSCW